MGAAGWMWISGVTLPGCLDKEVLFGGEKLDYTQQVDPRAIALVTGDWGGIIQEASVPNAGGSDLGAEAFAAVVDLQKQLADMEKMVSPLSE